MIHIKTQSRGLNKQSDTEMLSDSYNPIIQHVKSDYHKSLRICHLSFVLFHSF